jgi:hypothetical protein
MVVANTLAYNNTATIMGIKSFEILGSPLREGKIRLEKDFLLVSNTLAYSALSPKSFLTPAAGQQA